MSDTTATTWLTQESYDRLSAELEEHSGPARADIAKKIEARIRQLTQLLRNSTVGEAPESHGVVEVGTVVTATIAGDASTFLLGSREIADDSSDIDVYPESSPLGQAILGLKVGESTKYTAPNGKEITVKVTKVDTYKG